MKHVHADLMMQYAKDAMHYEKPWELWQQYDDFNNEWFELNLSPRWCVKTKYRRKPQTVSFEVDNLPKPYKGEIKNKLYWKVIVNEGGFIYEKCVDGSKISFKSLNTAVNNNLVFEKEEDAKRCVLYLKKALEQLNNVK